jgi:CRISPR-associated exonuclease Cas4
MNVAAWLMWFAVAACAVLVAVLALHRRRGAAAKTAELASRPLALSAAKLVYMEEQFRIRTPIPLVARVDRVYREADGDLVLVELKTRRSDRVYVTDVIQLSVQRMAVKGQTRRRVAAHGFVSVQTPGGTAASRAHRVKLLEPSDVVALYRRREDIVAGRVVPKYAESSSACRACAFRAHCDRKGA